MSNVDSSISTFSRLIPSPTITDTVPPPLFHRAGLHPLYFPHVGNTLILSQIWSLCSQSWFHSSDSWVLSYLSTIPVLSSNLIIPLETRYFVPSHNALGYDSYLSCNLNVKELKYITYLQNSEVHYLGTFLPLVHIFFISMCSYIFYFNKKNNNHSHAHGGDIML